jgi:hypothetical protein
MKSTEDRIYHRIRRHGRGKVFIVKEFLGEDGRAAVDHALSRMEKGGILVRIGRGLYHYPRKNPRLKMTLPPEMDDVAEAVGKQTGSRVVPSGALAANSLGISTQVPAKSVYLTDGRTRRVRVGNKDVILKHVSPKELPSGHPLTAKLVQALRYLGKDAINDELAASLRKRIPASERRKLAKEAQYTTDWIGNFIRHLSEEPVHG